MSLTSKSPERVAREALAVATTALPRYPHKFSPKIYTQPQLFACLVLKTFFNTDYRGIAQLLADLPELVRTLGLETVPHFTTLHKAARRLLRLPLVHRLLTVTIRRVRPRRRRVALAAMDSTGFECRHISAYYVRRRSRERSLWQTTTYTRFSKLEAVVDCARHLVIGAIPRRGPRVDVDRFVPLLNSTLQRVHIGTILADAGYDSEPNHRHARERWGIRSVIPATAGRPTDKLPTGRYRRLMKRRLTKTYCHYGQRWQVETVFSMLKRRLGSAISGRSYWSQCRDLLLRVLTHNVMIRYLEVFYRAVLSAFAILDDRLICSVRQDVRFLFCKITSRPRVILNLTQTSYASIDITMLLAPCRILIRSSKRVRPGKTVLDGPARVRVLWQYERSL